MKMHPRKIVSPLVLPLHLFLVLVFLGRHAFAQNANGTANIVYNVTFQILSKAESSPGQSTNGEQMYTYVAKITDEKPDKLDIQDDSSTDQDSQDESSQDEESTEMDGSSGEKSQEIVSQSTQESPSQEIVEMSTTLASASLNSPISSTSEALSIAQKRELQTLRAEHHIRLVRQGSLNEKITESGATPSMNEGYIKHPRFASDQNFSENGTKPRKPAGAGVTSGGGSKPYNVARAKEGEVVNPSLYNFFQFRPRANLGWLYMQRLKLGRDGGLGDDDGYEDQDANSTDWEYRQYDRACLYEEYQRQKSDATIPTVAEELKRIVDGQNEILARKFLDWQFNGRETHEAIALQDQAEKHPLFLSFTFLKITMELFRDKICRNASSYAVAAAAFAPTSVKSKAGLSREITVDKKLLPESFVDDIFSLFLVLREITMEKNVPDYASASDEEEVLNEALKKCQAEAENVTWFSHSCGDQILSNDVPNNFACTPLVDYDFDSKLNDPILDAMWHMFNAVHSYCYKYFLINIRLWHKYSLIIANTYTIGMRQRWKASVASQKFYMRLLGPDHKVHLETINRCTFATVLRSDLPAILPRFDTLSPSTFGKEITIHKEAAAPSKDP